MVVLRARLFVSSSLLSISKEVSSTAGMCVRLVHKSSCCYSHVSVAVVNMYMLAGVLLVLILAHIQTFSFLGLWIHAYARMGRSMYLMYVPHNHWIRLELVRVNEWMNTCWKSVCYGCWQLYTKTTKTFNWKYCDYMYTSVTYTGVRPHKCINIHCQHTWTIEYQNKTINIGENENKTQTTHAIHVKSTRFLWKMKRKLAIRHCADTNTREKSTPLCIGIGIGEWDDLCSFREIKWLLYQLQASIMDICFN